MYVNAWDPWTIIGNGNENDNSLDGYWGKSTNMSVLGWFLTNPEMTFRPVFMHADDDYDKLYIETDIDKKKIDPIASEIITKYNGSIIKRHPLHKNKI